MVFFLTVVYKTITTAGSSVVIPVTSTVTLTLNSTKVETATETKEIVKTATATEEVIKPTTIEKENTVTRYVKKPVTYTVVETKVIPTTIEEVSTSFVPTGQFLFSILVNDSLKFAFEQLSTKLSPLPAVQLSFL